MTSIEIYRCARSDGISLALKGSDILVKGSKVAVTNWLPALKKHKPKLVRVLGRTNLKSERRSPGGRPYGLLTDGELTTPFESPRISPKAVCGRKWKTHCK